MYVPAGISPTSYTAGISNPLVTIIFVIYYMNNFNPTCTYQIGVLLTTDS